MNPDLFAQHGPTPHAPYRRGAHWLALFATLFTFPLLFVGGSVTSFGVGMAVPDWPTTFQINMFLYDFWNAPFGVQVEHSHRLYGAAVGLATVVLTFWLLAFEPRRWLKILGVIALAAVIVQGVLGGTRVTRVSTFLAAVHGCIGQAFFGLMVAIAVVTGRDWIEAGPPATDTAGLRRRGAALVVLIGAQVAIGAWFRHYGSIVALGTHILMALVVWGSSAWLVLSIARQPEPAPSLRSPAFALGSIVTLQLILGVLALGLMLPLGGNPRTPTLWQAMTRTAHQTGGALLLATALVLALRAFRHLATSDFPPSSSPEPLAQPSRALEAVA
ncbi:MAG: hypothetical protein NVSMB9_28860 [Isosphaeraceae bacterium]